MSKILTDEADELLLDVREHLGNVIDHPNNEIDKEKELQTAFDKVQEIIKLTDEPKLSKEQQSVYSALQQLQIIARGRLNYQKDFEIYAVVRAINEQYLTADKYLVPALRKFLDEVTE